MSPSLFLNALVNRFSAAWRDAAASAVAAVIAWTLAVWLLGHAHPIFAAISALVCLSPGLPSHGRQAVGLMLGVGTGILVGELALLLPEGITVPEGLSLLRLASATFFAMLVAASFGLAPVVPIQAGVSAVLVLALGPENAGLARMGDVAIGAAVGLVFSQVLLTPDPIRQIGASADALFLQLGEAFKAAGDSLERRDARRAEVALQTFSRAHDSLIALGAGIEAARYSAHWSLRGRLAARAVAETAARYDRRAIRLFASALLFGEALADALRKDSGPPPEKLREIIQEVANRCFNLASAHSPTERASVLDFSESSTNDSWRSVLVHLDAVSDVLCSLEDISRALPETA